MIDLSKAREDHWIMTALVGLDNPFTRSNGTVMSRIYERLTKASRRRADTHEGMNIPIHLNDAPPTEETFSEYVETIYRQGVYDALKTLQEELKS